MTAESPGPLTTAQRRAILEVFARALRREAHNLQRWPQLTWQQFYNRLQWEDEPLPGVLGLELGRRTAPGGASTGRGRRFWANRLVQGRPCHQGTPVIQFCRSSGEGYPGGVL
jgi:hypothetical protein